MWHVRSRGVERPRVGTKVQSSRMKSPRSVSVATPLKAQEFLTLVMAGQCLPARGMSILINAGFASSSAPDTAPPRPRWPLQCYVWTSSRSAKIFRGTPHPARGHPLPSSDEGRGQGEGSALVPRPSTLVAASAALRLRVSRSWATRFNSHPGMLFEFNLKLALQPCSRPYHSLRLQMA